MEPPKRMTLNYSLKNIPVPSNRLYLKKLIEMTESVLKRMRWRAFFFLRSDDMEVEQREEEYYGFNSRRCPPQMDELKSFEDDVEKLIGNIQFRQPRDNFKKTLQKDAATIRGSKDMFVPADKTKNIYRMERAQYERLLRQNITKHYKVAEADAYDIINMEAKAIASRLDIAGRMDSMA